MKKNNERREEREMINKGYEGGLEEEKDVWWREYIMNNKRKAER